MVDQNADDSMLDLYIFETTQNIKQLEQIALKSENQNGFTQEDINEIFRIMHTIKGSSAMMSYDEIALLAHKMEDLFSFLREKSDLNYDKDIISDLMLESADIFNVEIENISNGNAGGINTKELVSKVNEVLGSIKGVAEAPVTPVSSVKKEINELTFDKENGFNFFKALITFEDGCEMENLRAFNLIMNLKEKVEELCYFPEDLENNTETVEYIKKDGFSLFLETNMTKSEIEGFLSDEAFIKNLSVTEYKNSQDFKSEIENITNGNKIESDKADGLKEEKISAPQDAAAVQKLSGHKGMITVNVSKLDELMDMIGELVIAESMVINNPELKGLDLNNFNKAAHQLHKITNELQDLTMSVRMVPLTNTFQKMIRIVRDMTKKLGKEVNLELIGAETEVDKNIIDHLSDPLMHLVRNAIDHGIESPEERIAAGKNEKGTVVLEARNDSGEILILIKDDGKGLDKKKLLEKAKSKELLKKPESEMTDKEIFSLICLPGFSTNEKVTEFSGRGVGMDVVTRNVEELGGRVSIDSIEGKGTQFSIRFPLTLAIIDGMNIRVGESIYTLPITVIKESLKPDNKNIITDPQKREMILFRGQCYPIIRLHELYNVKSDSRQFSDGIFIMIESDGNTACLFADELMGENQVVVKPLPNYLKQIIGIAGCTILGDSQMSLILDASELVSI
ncbi:MAG: putative chemotaxis protein CheA [Clostridia bacterium]|nr:putative chemotaxis protein CheA [Clostridia bacterium]